MVFLDADSTPLQDPEILFSTKTYKKNGNLFWNDFWKDPVPLWPMLHLENDPWYITEDSGDSVDARELDSLSPREIAKRSLKYPLQAESGQIYLDRVKYWEILEWVLFLNTHDSFVYRFSMGDKDTFRAAFELAGLSNQYSASPFGPALPLSDLGPEGEKSTKPSIRYRCLGMLQLHPENGSPFFHHRTADSKFKPHENPKEFLSAITHVTPPVTSDQASIMNWGNPGYSIFHAEGSVTWGLKASSTHLAHCSSISEDLESLLQGNQETRLTEKDIATSSCPCPPLRLHDANLICTGKDNIAVEMEPDPILVIEIPHNSYIYRVSQFEVEAYSAIPFQEVS